MQKDSLHEHCCIMVSLLFKLNYWLMYATPNLAYENSSGLLFQNEVKDTLNTCMYVVYWQWILTFRIFFCILFIFVFVKKISVLHASLNISKYTES